MVNKSLNKAETVCILCRATAIKHPTLHYIYSIVSVVVAVCPCSNGAYMTAIWDGVVGFFHTSKC